MHRRIKPYRSGIPLKKKFGQHFLKDPLLVDKMTSYVHLDDTISVMEIGCGEGILTEAILRNPCKQLKVFEIDHDWASYVQEQYGSDSRLQVVETNVLDVDLQQLKSDTPWVMLANLPYQITFPILHLVQRNRFLFNEGVVMIQEEVAQKIVKTSGRGYGYPSLFFQHYFELKLLDKIPPEAFFPPPKVQSRLLYFKPRVEVREIVHEEEFWKFIKICFHQPRRTLKNNFAQSHFDISSLDDALIAKRAQELSMDDLLQIWSVLKK